MHWLGNFDDGEAFFVQELYRAGINVNPHRRKHIPHPARCAARPFEGDLHRQGAPLICRTKLRHPLSMGFPRLCFAQGQAHCQVRVALNQKVRNVSEERGGGCTCLLHGYRLDFS